MDSSSSCSFRGSGLNKIETNNRIVIHQTAKLLHTPHFHQFGMKQLYFVYKVELITQIYSEVKELFKGEVEKYVGVKVIAHLIVDYSMSIEKDLPMNFLNSDLVKLAMSKQNTNAIT